MFLEAIWLKDGNEVYRVAPVVNIVCDDDMRDIGDIEIRNDYGNWISYNDADDFEIRLVKGE